jgi:hypothetical protein
MRASPAAATALLCGLLVLSGCDSAPGPVALEGRPPRLSTFTYSPESIVFNQLPPDQVSGEEARIPVRFSVTVADTENDVVRIGYLVQSPVEGRPALAEGEIDVPGPGRFEGTAEVRIPRGDAGTYTVLVYAVDREGHLSNQVRGALRFTSAGEPPVVEQVEAPETITRPAAGEPDLVLRLVATVRDPDGVSTLGRVVFWNVTAPAATFDLFDDGDREESGDEVAGDGRYTRLIRIASTNQPGTNVLAFQATDRSGLKSNIVEKQIRVE